MIIWMLNFAASTGYSQAIANPTIPAARVQKTDLPKFLILPWETPGVDRDSLRLSEKARIAVTERLKQVFSPNADSLANQLKSQNLFSAADQRLKNTWADPTLSPTRSLAIIPLWTFFHDQALVGLLVIDAHQNTIQHFQHKLIPRGDLIDAKKLKNLEGIFLDEFSRFSTQVPLQNMPKIPQDLAISIREQASTRRLNEIDRTTLNLILGYQLAIKEEQRPAFIIINPFASETLAAIHSIYGLKKMMRRPNRIIFTKLTYDTNPFSIKLPLSLKLGISMTEAIFAKSLPEQWFEPLSIRVSTTNEVALDLTNKTVDLINNEKRALQRDELPAITKIRGAWAYVDKGRAWGLQMNDRLIKSDGSPAIKGHVIGYYGPEMNLKSPRGYKISEGAIIFIRTGQKFLEQGQIFSYDPMTVPSF